MKSHIHPEQLKIYKAMTPAEKLDAALSLMHSARRMKAAALRELHPDWSDEKVQAEVSRIFLHART